MALDGSAFGLKDLHAAAAAAGRYADAVKSSVRALVSVDGKLDRKRLDAEQHVVHGLAWIATYAETLAQVAHWAERLGAEGKFGETEALMWRAERHPHLSSTTLPKMMLAAGSASDVTTSDTRLTSDRVRSRPPVMLYTMPGGWGFGGYASG